MPLLEWTLNRIVDHRARAVARAQTAPSQTQERVLRQLLRTATDTRFGREHGFAHIRTIADYQKQTPIRRYEDFAPLWQEAVAGRRDVTWPGRIPFFAQTSGTTTGSSKAMPVSRQMIKYNIRSGISLLARVRPWLGPRLLAGPTLYFGGSTRLRPLGAALAGDASGIASRHVPRFARRYRLPEPQIADLDHWETKVQKIVENYLDAPVQLFVGLPPWSLILFRKLIDHARRCNRPVETVSEIWTNLKAFVHFGMAVDPYRTAFSQLFGEPIPLFNTYSSSEAGMTAIQAHPDDPTMLMELDNGVFYEFVPLEQIGKPNPDRLTIDQVEIGPAYAILISTASGCWAYNLGDAVRFTSLKPPGIVFASRVGRQLNAIGENVIEEHLEAAVSHASTATGSAIEHYTVFSRPPNAQNPRGRHLWLVEFSRSPDSIARFARTIDQQIAAQSDDYATHREGDFGMDIPEIISVPPGTFYRWMAQRGKLGGQHKLPRITLDESTLTEIRNHANPDLALAVD